MADNAGDDGCELNENGFAGVGTLNENGVVARLPSPFAAVALSGCVV